ncbi:AlbA family DNA-binding domain-containing protein [Rhodoglobus sp.]
MTTHWTALHRSLGLDARPLTIEDIHEAIIRRVQETDELEWKREPPSAERREDLAGDVAALANARGGLICIGVEEDSATSAASAVRPTSITDQARRNLRQSINASMRPTVAGVDVIGLPLEEGESEGVVLIVVPASASAPHLIEKRGEPWWRAPIRRGASTSYMEEGELGRAYATRGAARSSLAVRHSELLEDLTNRTPRKIGRLWLLMSAVPESPIPTELTRSLGFNDRQELTKLASNRSSALLPHGRQRTPIISRLEPDGSNQHRGPRSWITHGGWGPLDEPGMTSGSCLMLAEDGSVLLALECDYGTAWEGKTTPLNVHDVESLSADFFAVVDCYSQALGGLGTVDVRAQALVHIPSPVDRRLELIESAGWEDSHRRIDTVRRSVRIDRLRPISMTYEPDTGPAGLERGARSAALDIESQFGVGRLDLFPHRD